MLYPEILNSLVFFALDQTISKNSYLTAYGVNVFVDDTKRLLYGFGGVIDINTLVSWDSINELETTFVKMLDKSAQVFTEMQYNYDTVDILCKLKQCKFPPALILLPVGQYDKISKQKSVFTSLSVPITYSLGNHKEIGKVAQSINNEEVRVIESNLVDDIYILPPSCLLGNLIYEGNTNNAGMAICTKNIHKIILNKDDNIKIQCDRCNDSRVGIGWDYITKMCYDIPNGCTKCCLNN